MAGTIEADLWHALDFLYGPCCYRCGLPLPEATTPEVICPTCIVQPPTTRLMRAALAYDDLSRPLVLGMKHGARKDGIKVYANWMMEAAPFGRRADMIVPVPLHWTRLWSRGYNQSAWLAAAYARLSKRPFLPQCLLRTKATSTQHGLSFAGRARNVAGAFDVSEDVVGKAVLLVDDVYTTGATMNACAKALLRAGAAHVDGVSLARVVRATSVDVPEEYSAKGPSLLDADV
jgi:ComF family protein